MDSVDSISQWWEIAKYVGAGGAFVLGIVCWKLWSAYREEVTYSKQRDRETLTVLAEMIKEDAALTTKLDNHQTQLIQAITELRNTVIAHMQSSKEK